MILRVIAGFRIPDIAPGPDVGVLLFLIPSCGFLPFRFRGQSPTCKLIDATSYGSSGNPKPTDLGNGVTVYLPSWKDLRPDGTCLEGQGITPDIPITVTSVALESTDPVLQAALTLLRKR